MTTTDATATRHGDAATAPSRPRRAAPWHGVASRFKGPTASFHYVIGITVLLLSIGLVMVQSSSSVRAYAEASSPFYFLTRQAIYVLVGLVAFYLALRIRFDTLRKLIPWFFGVSVLLLVAVLIPGIGSEVNGSRGWISLGAFAVQPAEIGRLAVIMMVAHSLAVRRPGDPWWSFLVPAGFAPLLVGGLTFAQPDMGMATAIMLAFVILIYLAGFSVWKLVWFLAGLGAVFVVFATTMAYRMSRMQVYLDTIRGNFDRASAEGYQSYQGLLSLSEGGLFGQGLGQSSAKWYYLPEASNDFIFAIIGEELGWVGALFVVALYGALAWVGLRIAARSVDPFRRLLAGAVATTISLQAFINIGYVVGLLPVTGIQLPLISYGGSSVVITLASLGLLANCARHEPEAISDYQSRLGERRRWWSLPMPLPYTPAPLVRKSTTPGRSSTTATTYGQPVQRPRYTGVPQAGSGAANRTLMTGRTSRPAREDIRRNHQSPPPAAARTATARRGQLRPVPAGDPRGTAVTPTRSARPVRPPRPTATGRGEGTHYRTGQQR